MSYVAGGSHDDEDDTDTHRDKQEVLMTMQTHIMTSTGRATAAGLAVSFSAVRLRPLIAVVVASAVLLGVTLGA